MRKYLILTLIYFLTGCMTYTSGYTPRSNSSKNYPILNREERKSITFSLSYNSQVGDELSERIKKSMIDSVKEVFGKSGLYRRVHYLPFDTKNKYHYHFDIKVTGALPNEQAGAGMLIGLTFATIPSKLNYYLDITMFVFEDGKEIYSITAPEEVADIYWLPLIITSPFMNHYTALPDIIERTNQYFIQKIIENNLNLK